MTALVRGNQKYVWIYTDATRQDALRSLGRMAANPDLGFNWNDAVRVSASILKGKVTA